MAKQIANVDILVDTYNTWILRTNEIIGALGSEVLTANSSVAVTGSPASPKNARLYGNLQVSTTIANTAIFDSLQSNTTHLVINPTALLVAGGGIGDLGGKYLTSNATHVYWSVAPGQGTVTSVANGVGLVGGPITSSGTLRVKAGAGIDVDARGVSVNTQFLASQTSNALTLQGRTWEIPGALGATTPNTAVFTTVTAITYKAFGDDSFLLNKDMIRLAGMVDAMTPGDGTTDTTGGVRVRSRGTGKAALQFTNQAGTVEYGAFTVGSNKQLTWSGSQVITGNLAISTTNGSGGGLTLSDDGDIADLNDGYASMRFSSGVAVYSQNKGGVRNISLGSDGTIVAAGNIYSNNDKRVITLEDYTTGGGNAGQQWARLPNGMILQWGSLRAPSPGNSSVVSLLPTSYNIGYQVFISPLSDYDDNDDGNEVFYAQQTALSYFTFYNATPSDNNPTDFSWFTIGY